MSRHLQRIEAVHCLECQRSAPGLRILIDIDQEGGIRVFTQFCFKCLLAASQADFRSADELLRGG